MGNEFNGYKILKEIKPSGAWADVFIAEREGSQYALKVLKKKHCSNPESVKNFINEAKTLKKFDHPNLPQILDIGELSSSYFFSMEYFARGNLNDFLKTKKFLPTSQIIEIGIQVCRGLNAINKEGYLHLDLKPSNILFAENNRVVVTDFGSSRSLLNLSEPGLRTGTPQYMSPEHFDSGNDLTFASDLYSLGVIMYYMGCGQLPFNSNDYQQLELLHCSIEPIPISEIKPDVDKRLAKIIHKLLAKKVENRYRTTLELLFELQSITRGNEFYPDRICIKQLDFKSRVIKSRVYLNLPVDISSREESPNNFCLSDAHYKNKVGRVEGLDDGLILLRVANDSKCFINDKVYLHKNVPLNSNNETVRIDSLNFQFERIKRPKISLGLRYISISVVISLIVLSIFVIGKINSIGSEFYISDLKISPSTVSPDETFHFDFSKSLDSSKYIESILIAPFGRDDQRKQTVKTDEKSYKYSFNDTDPGKQKFTFAVKAIDNDGNESNWIEKKVEVHDFSDKLSISNLTIPSSLRINNSLDYKFAINSEIPDSDILIEVSIMQGNDQFYHNILPSTEHQGILCNKQGNFIFRIRAFDKDHLLYSSPLDKPFTVIGNYPSPEIKITSSRQRKDNTFLISFFVYDTLFSTNELTKRLVVNKENIEISANANNVSFQLAPNTMYNYYLEVKTPDGRIGRTETLTFSTIPQPRIDFSGEPQVRGRKIRFAYTYDDPNKNDDVEIYYVLNGQQYPLENKQGGVGQHQVDSAGNYSLFLEIIYKDKIIGKSRTKELNVQ
ncbi:MAG: serine/threonine protein kinase [Ignavibacteriales bacterium]|nr:serine/threonine protein kinase [Ignavibacteriales bacterium]